MGAAADPALDRLAVGAGVGRARQHRVLGGHPALAGALAPARHALGEARRAQHPGLAELDEHAALGVVQPAPGDRHVAQLVGGVVHRVGSCRRPYVASVRPSSKVAPGVATSSGPDQVARGLAPGGLGVVPGRQVGQHQPPYAAGVGRRLPGPPRRSGARRASRRGPRRTPSRPAAGRRRGTAASARAGVGVAGVGQHRAVGLDPHAVGLDGCSTGYGVTVNGPIRHRLPRRHTRTSSSALIPVSGRPS